jgi:hypothetical protein
MNVVELEHGNEAGIDSTLSQSFAKVIFSTTVIVGVSKDPFRVRLAAGQADLCLRSDRLDRWLLSRVARNTS